MTLWKPVCSNNLKNRQGDPQKIMELNIQIKKFEQELRQLVENLIPPELTKQQVIFVYASEADILNIALFGKTANQWRDENPNEKGNIRDYANVS